jgi:hypothetical protein
MTKIKKTKIKKNELLADILSCIIKNYPVIDIAKNLGLKVKVSNELPIGTKGFIKQLKDDSVVICVNEKMDRLQQECIVASGLLAYLSNGDIKEGVIFL